MSTYNFCLYAENALASIRLCTIRVVIFIIFFFSGVRECKIMRKRNIRRKYSTHRVKIEKRREKKTHTQAITNLFSVAIQWSHLKSWWFQDFAFKLHYFGHYEFIFVKMIAPELRVLHTRFADDINTFRFAHKTGAMWQKNKANNFSDRGNIQHKYVWNWRQMDPFNIRPICRSR